jgi:hypothetical protein
MRSFGVLLDIFAKIVFYRNKDSNFACVCGVFEFMDTYFTTVIHCGFLSTASFRKK